MAVTAKSNRMIDIFSLNGKKGITGLGLVNLELDMGIGNCRPLGDIDPIKPYTHCLRSNILDQL